MLFRLQLLRKLYNSEYRVIEKPILLTECEHICRINCSVNFVLAGETNIFSHPILQGEVSNQFLMSWMNHNTAYFQNIITLTINFAISVWIAFKGGFTKF